MKNLVKRFVSLVIVGFIFVSTCLATDVFILGKSERTLDKALEAIVNSSAELACGHAYQIGRYYKVEIDGQHYDMIATEKKNLGSLVVTALKERSAWNSVKGIAVSKNVSLDELRRLINGSQETSAKSSTSSAGQSMGLLGLSTEEVSSNDGKDGDSNSDSDGEGVRDGSTTDDEQRECEIRSLTPLEELIAFALGKRGYESRCYAR